jgi:hypothetical protein
MSKTIRSLVSIWFLAFTGAAYSNATCPPPGWSVDALNALKAQKFVLEDATQRHSLARGLVPCLADPDPVLRDALAFEALSHWMRQGRLDGPTVNFILEASLRALQPEVSDSNGFSKPFAALVLAEVARMDRISPLLSDTQRSDLVRHAANYLRGVTDYRGFDEAVGWRHGVAHGADWVMQLSLNPKLGQDHIRDLMAAVFSQVAPGSGHFYIYGEGERLARPLLLAARREISNLAEFRAMIAELSSPGQGQSWDAALKSQTGLARLHNVKAFLSALYLGIQAGNDLRLKEGLGVPALEALKQLP